MSPLACPLALATAALLAAVLAVEDISQNADTTPPGSYKGVCHTQAKGIKSSNTVRLTPMVVPPLQAKFEFDIPNKCVEQNMELSGGVVTACDSDEPPILTVAPKVIGKGSLRRSGTILTTAECYVQLYCV